MPDVDTTIEKTKVEVFDWVAERLLELGFSKEDAEMLAALEVDYREARALIERGCPIETAFQLLLPL